MNIKVKSGGQCSRRKHHPEEGSEEAASSDTAVSSGERNTQGRCVVRMGTA